MIIASLALMMASGCKKNDPATDPNTVTDCQGYTYPIVKIGNQTWMAENLRCTKYDTESERPGAVIPETPNENYTPYCIKAYDRGNWYYGDGLDKETSSFVTGKDLSEEQVSKLGCLYNWAAAVGFATKEEALAQAKEFDKPRQGICPNGWHLPTYTEWDELAKALGGVLDEVHYQYPEIGKKMKSESGWYKLNGTNVSGLNFLPAGHSDEDGKVTGVGLYTTFCTASTGYDNEMMWGFECMSDALGRFDSYAKLSDGNIRCVKN